MSDDKQFVDPTQARSEEYRSTLDAIKQEGVCPFCKETMKWHTNPILKRAGGWIITKTTQPYENAAHHLLLIPEAHKEGLENVTGDDWDAIRDLVTWYRNDQNIQGGGLTVRFGDYAFGGSSVKHIHFHFIVPVVIDGMTRHVDFPIG
jgi:diadenosine tetraphosphate (Ap4A) HIT family hydrolase